MKNFLKICFFYVLFAFGGTAFAGHMFTQGTTNTPTWIQSGKGIAIDQYGLESGSQFSVYIEQPRPPAPSAADTSNSNWWNWSAGDVMKLNFATTTGAQTFTIAYDAGGTCVDSAYTVCGQTDLNTVTNLISTASGLSLSLPSGSLSSTNSYTWSIVADQGEFSIGGFRIGFANGKVHGSRTGPLSQNSVVNASTLPAPGGSTPPIDLAASAYTVAELNNNQVLPKFAGGVLSIAAAGDVATAFTVTNLGGTINTGANDVTFSGAITDDAGSSGVLKKIGTGVLALTGTNTFTGGVQIEAGKVAITSDANLGAASASIALAGGVLQVNENMTTARTLTLSSVAGSGVEVASNKEMTQTGLISGTGGMTKSGSGVLSLSDGVIHTFTGDLNLSQGSLRLNATLANSGVTVATGALLSGAGVVGGNVAVSGAVSPGNSPGTLTVLGDMTMAAGSNFLAEIDGRTYAVGGGAGTYDRIALTSSTGVFTAAGTVSPILRGISTPANNDFVPVYGDRFRVVSTANSTGVTGAFGAVTDPGTGMPTNSRFDVIYGANFIDLTLTPASMGAFARAYGLKNMVNAAEALDGVRPAQGVNLGNNKGQYFDGLYGLNPSQLALALLQSSGQIHAVALGTNRSGIFSQYGRLSNYSQLREPTDNLWVDVSGYNSRIGEDSFASSFHGSGGQVWLGKDMISRPGQTFGVAVGQLKSRIRDVSSQAESTSNMLALYMLGQKQAFDYDAMIGYNDSKSDIDRRVSLASGTENNNARPSWSGFTVQAGLGYAHELASGVFGRAYSRVAIDHTIAKGFAETGSSLTALTAGEQNYTSGQLTLGYDFNGRITSPMYKDVNWRIGAGSTFLAKGRDAFVDRSVSMHDATWSVSEASYTRVIPFVQMSANQRVNDKLNFILSASFSRVANMLWRNTGYVGLSYKL